MKSQSFELFLKTWFRAFSWLELEMPYLKYTVKPLDSLLSAENNQDYGWAVFQRNFRL